MGEIGEIILSFLTKIYIVINYKWKKYKDLLLSLRMTGFTEWFYLTGFRGGRSGIYAIFIL